MRFLFLLLTLLPFSIMAEPFAGTLTTGINYVAKEKVIKVYTWKVLRVIDGDTIKVYIPSFPEELNPISIRVRGIDTPEKSKSQAKCENEIILALKATEFTKTIIFNSLENIKFSDISWDKYGGRIVANVHIDETTQLSDLLIKNGFARPYDGRKKSSWCN